MGGTRTTTNKVLSGLLRHRNHDVCHAAAGALGELIFFACTMEAPPDTAGHATQQQQQQQQLGPAWVFPRQVFARLSRVLLDTPRATGASATSSSASSSSASSSTASATASSSFAVRLRVVHLLENVFVHANSRQQRQQQQQRRRHSSPPTPPPRAAVVAVTEFATLPIAHYLLQAYVRICAKQLC